MRRPSDATGGLLGMLARAAEFWPDAVLLVDDRGRIVQANDRVRALLDFRPEELLGEPVELLAPIKSAERHAALRAGYMRRPTIRPMGAVGPLRARRRDGQEIPVDISLSPFEENGRTFVLAAIRDASWRVRLEASERRRKEAENEKALIARAADIKAEYIAAISHELRTPLTSILGSAELLEEHGTESTTDSMRLVEGILASSRYLLQLVNDVLDLATLEAGRFRFFPEHFDLAALVGDVRDILLQPAVERNVSLDTFVSAGLEDLLTDPVRLKQVLLNLGSNAIKFSPDGGKVTLRVLPEGAAKFRLEVADSGPGIAETDVGRLFVAFERLDSGSSARPPGTGLGLALTKRLVESQGGEVGVETRRGGGSTFHAILPRRPPEGDPGSRR